MQPEDVGLLIWLEKTPSSWRVAIYFCAVRTPWAVRQAWVPEALSIGEATDFLTNPCTMREMSNLYWFTLKGCSLYREIPLLNGSHFILSLYFFVLLFTLSSAHSEMRCLTSIWLHAEVFASRHFPRQSKPLADLSVFALTLQHPLRKGGLVMMQGALPPMQQPIETSMKFIRCFLNVHHQEWWACLVVQC